MQSRTTGFPSNRINGSDVLDELDQNNSVFVVAPTSVGKTFISFYAISKVLQEDDTGMLVYVAPTKALVNQIAAETHGRFRKTYPRNSEHSVWAIHTRDIRFNNPMKCQVLVTVPHMLQIVSAASPFLPFCPFILVIMKLTGEDAIVPAQCQNVGSSREVYHL